MKRNTRVVWILCVCLWALSCLGCARNGNALAQYAPDEADRLTVYTSHKQEVYEPIITEFENRTGIWVTVETGGTNELLERIASETGSPVCDIMFGGGVDSLESYKGYFSPYQSPEEAGIDPAFLSEDHMWAPFSILPTVIIYNQKLVPAHTVTGWRDLIDPRWKGKIAFADPSASGSSYTALATLCQIIPKDTESVLRQFAKNLGGSQFGGSGDVVKAVADGTCFLGITLEETAMKRIAEGYDIKLLYPAEGTSAVPDGSALIKGAPHEDNAKLFLDFVLSRGAQERLAQQFYRRHGAARRVLPVHRHALPVDRPFREYGHHDQNRARETACGVRRRMRDPDGGGVHGRRIRVGHRAHRGVLLHFHHVPDHFCNGDQEPRDPQEARRLVHDHGYRGRGDHAVFYGVDRGLHAHRGGVSPAAVLLRLRRPVRCGIWAAGEGITGRRGLPLPFPRLSPDGELSVFADAPRRPMHGGIARPLAPHQPKALETPSSCNSAVKGVNHAGKQEKIYGSVVPFDHAV